MSPPKMNIVRKPSRRGSAPTKIGTSDSPRSPAAMLLSFVRPRLPIWLQYGAAWRLLTGLTFALQFTTVALVGYGFFGTMNEEQRAEANRKFVFIRNEQGEVCDIARDFQVEAGMRAKKRSQRIADGDMP
jgi:hypothetical protein